MIKAGFINQKVMKILKNTQVLWILTIIQDVEAFLVWFKRINRAVNLIKEIVLLIIQTYYNDNIQNIEEKRLPYLYILFQLFKFKFI